jgi:hypothetical protein
VINCCWSSSAQWFSVQSSTGLLTIFNCLTSLVEVKVNVILRPTASRPVYLGVKPHLRSKTRFLLLSGSCGFVDVGRLLWREDWSVLYNWCWLSPAQSFSVPSLAGHMIIFYCLRFETYSTWRARFPDLYPPGTGWPSYTFRHWVPYSSPPTTRRKYSNPPPHGLTDGSGSLLNNI